ncbi:pentatricopeptide repeat-containing protein At1g55630-like isoform X2 [Vitis riparia]|uniref:pentatricopeptide repeat-containing protein At1g55630-like isoform X2 n=1 Tax=Vitis riparia TaxID=96939 RepID=UPI00155B284E|nr:pentatricopeptide repeat-containing protein At1g55630-like isoform X2 [Vitis riparia]
MILTMNSIALFGPRLFRIFPCFCRSSRSFSTKNSDGGEMDDGFMRVKNGGEMDDKFMRIENGGEMDDGFMRIEKPLSEAWGVSNFDPVSDENPDSDNGIGSSSPAEFLAGKGYFDNMRLDASRVLEILQQDCPGFSTKAALDELQIRVSGGLVREVLLEILKTVNYTNKERCAKLGYKFFMWSGQQENYRHTVNAYHLIMKIFAESDEFKAMWRLVDEMIEQGFPVTARTFQILICTCGEAGLARRAVERLGKLDQFHRLLEELGTNGFSPDFHTFNILLHLLGKGNKPLAALDLLNHMKEVGFDPSVLHFTTLIDGLSRAGNLDACKYFFDEMIKLGCMPDVVCYTVMITGYIVAGELEMAQGLFEEMTVKGQLPNVFTYNSMIRGLCMAEKFEEARSMLKEMESRGCNPNFLVYNTLVGNLRNAGKLKEAHEVIRHMVDKGQYVHLLSKFKGYRRC